MTYRIINIETEEIRDFYSPVKRYNRGDIVEWKESKEMWMVIKYI